MDNMSEVLRRANLRKIGEFLLNGKEEIDEPNGLYNKEIEDATLKMNNILRKYFRDDEDVTNIMNSIFEFSDVYERVCMEAGIRCGMMLAKDLIK